MILVIVVGWNWDDDWQTFVIVRLGWWLVNHICCFHNCEARNMFGLMECVSECRCLNKINVGILGFEN